MSNKLILDACCGGRMFWFDKHHPNALYIDNRVVEPHIVGTGKDARTRSVQPDRVMDFRKMDLPDNQFSLVVFDPPHYTSLGAQSYYADTYGRLDPKTWREDSTTGICRVLQGTQAHRAC